MAATTFTKNLESIDFSVEKQGEGGVVLTKNFESQKHLSPQKIFALELARNKFEADAVYFRHFTDGRESVPQIYIYDYTDSSLTDKERKDIHKKVWSGCLVPLYIIVEKDEVKIVDARQNVDSTNYVVETILLTGDAVKSFSATSFDDGLFWEEKEYQKHFQYNSSAYRDLVTGLKKVYLNFQQKATKLDKHVALKLLVQCLLIKYLEERDQKGDSGGYFAKTYFKNNFGCKNFCEAIRANKLLELLDLLAKDFNGKIFLWDKKDEIEERKAITETNLAPLADYLDGDMDQNNQFVFWRLYSFSHLPVELISSVYEELLTNSKDIVYTPEMVVSLLVDECMPLKNPQPDFKLIDVSCGSGIFLVKAYKRLIQWWRYDNWRKSGRKKDGLEKPDLNTLIALLQKSIYGIDVESDAIRLSVFSLALALLDEVDLSPPLWRKLKFPDLSANISTKDFFPFITGDHPNDFDLVIGNPPFNPPPDETGKAPGNGAYFKTQKEKHGYESEISIPGDKVALHFLTQAMKLLKPNAMLCMIQPTGPFLYQKSEVFKKYLFTKHNLLQVIDFTNLADVLWEKKNVATIAAFFQKNVADVNPVMHVIANRANANVKKIFLQFDRYDFHWVTKENALLNSFSWKANMYGGGRLLALITRLASSPTFGDYLKKKNKQNQWVFGDGFRKGKQDADLLPADFEKKKSGYSEAPYLTGSRCVKSENFDENGIAHTYIIKEKYFQWKRRPILFKAPLLLIKKNIGIKSIPILYTDRDISYNNEIIGVHVPLRDIAELQRVGEVLRNNQLFRFYILITSSRAGISRSQSTLLQEDILNVPFAEGDIKLSKAEKIVMNDVLDYYLKPTGNNLDASATITAIKLYTKAFVQTLNSVYETSERQFRLFKILDSGSFYALHFEYTSEEYNALEEIVEELDQYIAQHIPTENPDARVSHHIQRILKIYGKDKIILAKPKKLRYWLQSIALRDADECFADYVKAGF